MKHILKTLLLACFALLISSNLQAQDDQSHTLDNIHILNIDGAIGPASADFIKRGLQDGKRQDADLIILRLNTPGGLVTSTRDIIQTMLNSDIPIATYVSPPGAHAASAGTYILYASHIAAMAPGTNIGAATPIHMQGGGQDQDNENTDSKSNEEKALNKALNDAIAQIKGLAELHGRNTKWAEEAVAEAATLTPNEAKDKKVVEFIAEDISDLIQQLDGHIITINKQKTTLKTPSTKSRMTHVQPDWRTRFLSIITDPNLVFILMTLGVYGLIYEFSNPGTFFPGVMGVICLMIALYALNVLPVNYAGLGLVALGLGLMIAEAFVVSYGVLGVGGVIAFILGATILFDTDIAAFRLSYPTIFGTAIVLGGGLTWLLAIIIKSQRNPPTTGDHLMIGREALVDQWTKKEKKVRFDGELWYARCDVKDFMPQKGESVLITAVDDLTLTVSPPPQTKE